MSVVSVGAQEGAPVPAPGTVSRTEFGELQFYGTCYGLT